MLELTSTFALPASVDRVWLLLTDIERVAPCVPGFQLQEIEGDEYRGLMKVKLGAVVMQYRSSITFLELDRENARVVMRAVGRETTGQGTAEAILTSTLTGDGQSTRGALAVEVEVTGRVAQFGRGVLADVTKRLTEQFVRCLEGRLL